MAENRILDELRRVRAGFARRLQRRHPAAAFRQPPSQEERDGATSDLARLFFAHQGRMVSKWTNYLDAYDRHFSAYRSGFPLGDGSTRPLRFLEIGVFHGGSLELWREYFGPDAIIYGIDIDERCAALDGEAGQVRIGSQTDGAFLRAVVEEMGGVDIVLDDGSHIATHMRASFDVLFPLLTPGGVYAAEDLHASYWASYEGGYRRQGAFIEVVKDFIDDLHADYHGRGRRRPLPAGQAIPTITIHEGIAFLDKEQARPSSYADMGTRTLW